MKLFVHGLVNVVTCGLNGKRATTAAQKQALLMNMAPHIKSLFVNFQFLL